MWINRSIQDSLLQSARTFPALLLTGARQTGKTSLLRHAFPQATYVSLEVPSTAELAETEPERLLNDSREPVIIDEIQYAPGLMRYLKVRIDENRSQMGRFLLTGSQKFQMMKDLSESLAGRVAITELGTLSAQELQGLDVSDQTMILRGGFPETYAREGIDLDTFFSSYVATYLERDVRSFFGVESLRTFDRFMRTCASRSGQVLNQASIARDVGVSQPTVAGWLSALEASNQITLVEPYFSNFGKRMSKAPKLYFRDTGLLCYLLGLRSFEQLVGSTFWGPIWETFVFNQLERAAQLSHANRQIFFWRTLDQREIDLVIDTGGKLRLIEAKTTERPNEKDIEPIRKVLKGGQPENPPHFVACRVPRDYRVSQEPLIRAVNPVQFFDWFGSESSG